MNILMSNGINATADQAHLLLCFIGYQSSQAQRRPSLLLRYELFPLRCKYMWCCMFSALLAVVDAVHSSCTHPPYCKVLHVSREILCLRLCGVNFAYSVRTLELVVVVLWKNSLVVLVMKSLSYFLVWQKRKLSDKPVEAGEDYTKFNSADFARKVSVCLLE